MKILVRIQYHLCYSFFNVFVSYVDVLYPRQQLLWTGIKHVVDDISINCPHCGYSKENVFAKR